MRILKTALCACLIGCGTSEDLAERARQPQQSLAIEVAGTPLLGSALWSMSVSEAAPTSDSLHIEGTAVAPATAESRLNQVVVDIPLRNVGQWKDSTLAISYTYKSYSEAPELGVAALYKADFVDGFDRYVIRAVDLKITSTGHEIAGLITLSPDNGHLPAEFDPALDLQMKIEGTVQWFGCDATTIDYVTETGVAVLKPSKEFVPECLARFHME